MQGSYYHLKGINTQKILDCLLSSAQGRHPSPIPSLARGSVKANDRVFDLVELPAIESAKHHQGIRSVYVRRPV
jgi:hypothetical protein